jgi:hypothetical protein
VCKSREETQTYCSIRLVLLLLSIQTETKAIQKRARSGWLFSAVKLAKKLKHNLLLAEKSGRNAFFEILSLFRAEK